MVEDTVGIIVAVAVVYVAYNWLFKGKAASPSSPAGPPVLGQGILRGVNESMVQTVSSTFPDLPRDNILYDLSKTKNVQRTVERILEVGTLPAPPPNLFPPTPLPSRTPTTSTTSTSSTTSARLTPTLIDRFNLSSRLPPPPSLKGKERAAAEPEEAEVVVGGGGGGGASKIGSNAAKWEATAEEREKSLKKRKEEMVLEARRKLLEKKARAAAAAASA